MGTRLEADTNNDGNVVKVGPERKIYSLGATLAVALTLCSRNFGDRGGPYFMASLTAAGIVYLLSVREFLAMQRLPRHVIVIGLVLASVWHIEFLRLPAGADDDIHRYVWDGRLQRLGYNPYTVIPNDPAVEALHTAETRSLNNPHLPSPYPAGAQLFFRVVTAIHESAYALKVAFVICDFAIAGALLDLLRTSGRGAHLVLVYAWNPLLAIEVAGSGHIDIVGVLLLVVSAAALARRWRGIAALSFGLAVAVKFLPIVLMPLYWKRVRIRDALVAAAVVALLYVPFVNDGRIPVGSLAGYVTGFRFNGPIFAALHHVAPSELLAGLAVLVGLATATWLRSANFEQSPNVFAWPMAASLLFAPVVFPWYLLWLVPFSMSPSTVVILIWTVSIIPTYVMWHSRALTGVWGTLPDWVMLLEYGCVAIAAAIVGLRQIRSSRTGGRPIE